jgi:large subunit ribosomal protein L25
MSEMMSLQVEVREKAGSKQAARLRENGKVPAVVYGHKKESIAIALNIHEFVEALHHSHRLFTAELPDGKQTLLLKALQYDYLGKDVIHVDFMRVDLTERVTVKVPLELRGTAKGAAHGGILDKLLASLEIECPVVEIPKSIPVIVRELEVGDSITAGQITLPADCVLKTDPKALVIICHEVAEIKTTEELQVEQPVAPEVITERAGKEEEGAGEGKEGKEGKESKEKKSPA